MEKRSLFKSLPGMTGLSLMNPWHAARTLLNPEVPESLRSNQPSNLADSRQQRSIIDELILMGPGFIKSKFRAMGPMLKRSTEAGDLIRKFDPKYLTFGKMAVLSAVNDLLESNPPQKKNMEIMRFGKRAI